MQPVSIESSDWGGRSRRFPRGRRLRLAGLALGFVLLVGVGAAETVKDRPANWAQPVADSSLGNFYRVSDDLYRSEQPTPADIPELQRVGIRTVLSLRHYHHDSRKFDEAHLASLQCRMDAGSVSIPELIEVLRLIRTSPKPVLVHCWHGSDRTGFVVAGYRMVFMGWTADAAIDELKRGGFGYHAFFYPNVIKALRAMNVAEVRQAVFAKEPAPAPAATEPRKD